MILGAVKIEKPVFPEDLRPDESGLVGWGADLSEATLVEAYSKGIFPWSGDPPIPWYSPDPRLVLFPEEFRASRSLKKLARKGVYRLTFDQSFRAVMTACAEVERPGQGGTWITGDLIDAYCRLHARRIAHSIEVWEGDTLVGGLYGLTLGLGFFGESMFAHRPNVSKLALMALCRELTTRQFHFIDCQQNTDHLRSLGASPISRSEYEYRLRRALRHEPHHYQWSSWGVQPP